MRYLQRGSLAVLTLIVLSITPHTAFAGHCHHCKRCATCCCQPPAPRGRAAEEPRAARAEQVVRAAVVPSMPMYTMPMMYAAMPVVPAMAAAPTRGAEFRGAGDCCDRVDRLEEEMKRLAQSVSELQAIVKGQTEVLKKLAERP